MSDAPSPRRIAIVGGGLAGLACAAALAGRGHHIEIFEAKRSLGGRAASFQDPITGEVVDHCQHVSMGCCTNLADFCRRAGIADCFRHDRTLHFFGPDSVQSDFAGAEWLPAPLHLAAAFLRLGYLPMTDRIRIGLGLWRLAWTLPNEANAGQTIATWLRDNGQTVLAVERFWSVVLVSALSESLDRMSVAAARQVFVDGFMSNRHGYELQVPLVPLSVLYGEQLLTWFTSQGVLVRLGAPVRRIAIGAGQLQEAGSGFRITLVDRSDCEFSVVVCALPWRRLADCLDQHLSAAIPVLSEIEKIESAPVTGVHLWFDRPISELPHAVLVGRLSQWVFRRDTTQAEKGHYYQVVISASRQLAGRDRESIVAEVCEDLRAVWPAAREAQLLHARVVTDQEAVFSVKPGMESIRPSQRTGVANLLLAGDWTATGWPSTMEGAVRSGYLAAESILSAQGTPAQIVQPDLPRDWLARLLLP